MSTHEQDLGNENAGSVPTFFREYETFFEYLDKIAATSGDPDTWALAEAPEEERELVRKASGMLEVYQEQPTCLDSHLERIISTLMYVVQEYVNALYDYTATNNALGLDPSTMDTTGNSISITRLSSVFDLLYMLCKVRGYKVVLRLFPHSVADVEPVFAMLWQYSSVAGGVSSWTTRYILLIWLSLLAMVPFDMESIDSGILNLPALPTSEADVPATLVSKWIELGKLYLNKAGCEMEGAAVMLARLLSRKDTMPKEQPAFVSWTVREISDAAGLNVDESSSSNNSGGKKDLGISAVLQINGALRVLCHLFLAMDSPAALSGQLEPLLTIFQSDAFGQHSVTRKLISKAAQRLALLFLPAVPAKSSDLYVGTCLRSNLRHYTVDGSEITELAHKCLNAEDTTDSSADQAAEIELSAEVEAFVGILFQKLNDRDTIVRWSAAKGIARIAERLPQALSHEIVSAVVSMLHEETLELGGVLDVSMTSESAWHGALMSLAELSRKGLLPPEILRETIPWIVRGLTYEIQRGNYSVGSNVRDAACYVMWSFARTSNPLSKAVFAELSTHMATTLISVAVFDRESNVRRAASAAYQEHVGRHSSFPHGISVLQLADFFSVGNMRNAFVVASRRIAEFAEYRKPLLHHLCTITIYHWDVKTRELAAKALFELAPLAPEYVIADLFSDIVANTKSPFLATRHGAILAAGVLAEVLASHLQADKQISETVLSVPKNTPERYVQDFGAALTLSALAFYIGCLSRAGWNIDAENNGTGIRHKQFFDYFVQGLTVCKEAQDIVPNFTAFVDKYGLLPEQHSIVRRYTHVEISGTSCQSFVLAIGALRTQDDFELLCKLIAEGPTVEIRRNAAAALGHHCMRWTQGECGGREAQDSQNELAAINALIAGLLDHTVDNRGDVGSWIRRQCLETLVAIFESDDQVLLRLMSVGGGDIAIRLLGRALHAATEKIDKLRAAAGNLLETLLYKQNIDDSEHTADLQVQWCVWQLRQCIPSSNGNNGSDINTNMNSNSGNENSQNGKNEVFSWADPEAAFGRLVYALSVHNKMLRQPLFEGLVVTGSTEPLGKFAVNAVSKYADTLPSAEAASPAVDGATAPEEEEEQLGWSADGIVGELTRLILTDRMTSKMINPALVVADQLVEQGALALASPEIQVAADQLFSMVCINGVVADADEERMEKIQGVLTETEWMLPNNERKAEVTGLLRQALDAASN
ncbi:hypothetical protein GGI25_002704 [Coemansia spiralis]|uniref:Tubulin-specific chaperone D n=1 Tax=Coemansia spiralis TaxID=417178 RepID=A0A9W8G8K6_9FUNG|nr:hypothetical protein GGI25_002704 [Coemansia spiralis]